MIKTVEGVYVLSGKNGKWSYQRKSEIEGKVFSGDEEVGTFTYRPISEQAVFGALFKWGSPLSPSKPMKCIDVISGEIMTNIQEAISADAYFVLPSQLNGAEYPCE